MLTPDATRLEVWGDPIDHSLSPRLHAAAYTALGWDWTYGRRLVDAPSFADELRGLAPSFRGLSLTYPLKSVAHAAAGTRDRHADLTGAVNTLLLRAGGRPLGFNTDVGGIVDDLGSLGIDAREGARIIGAGATATSALVALVELGAARVEIVARRPDAARGLVTLAERLGVPATAREMDASASAPVALTIATLPGGAALDTATATALANGGGVLYDVVYGHWPTPLATAWGEAGERAIAGRGMLVRQAVRQIRIFATGEVTQPLPHEDVIVDVMARAVMGD